MVFLAVQSPSYLSRRVPDLVAYNHKGSSGKWNLWQGDNKPHALILYAHQHSQGNLSTLTKSQSNTLLQIDLGKSRLRCRSRWRSYPTEGSDTASWNMEKVYIYVNVYIYVERDIDMDTNIRMISPGNPISTTASHIVDLHRYLYA